MAEQRCNHNCDPTDPEARRPNASHFLDCPVWSSLGVTAPTHARPEAALGAEHDADESGGA